ncbi:MAG: hypothetical protein GY765_22730 [bacterium]|nr:hypothetical protein [bacterium]
MRKSTTHKKLVLRKETVACLDFFTMTRIQAGELQPTGNAQDTNPPTSPEKCLIQPQETYTCDTDCTCPMGGSKILVDPRLIVDSNFQCP